MSRRARTSRHHRRRHGRPGGRRRGEGGRQRPGPVHARRGQLRPHGRLGDPVDAGAAGRPPPRALVGRPGHRPGAQRHRRGRGAGRRRRVRGRDRRRAAARHQLPLLVRGRGPPLARRAHEDAAGGRHRPVPHGRRVLRRLVAGLLRRLPGRGRGRRRPGPARGRLHLRDRGPGQGPGHRARQDGRRRSTTTGPASPRPGPTPTSRRCTCATPMVAIWDDHDIADNAWRHGAKAHDDAEHGPWEERLLAAATAWQEYLPYRSRAPEDPLVLWRSLPIGDLAEVVVLDTRIAGRDEHADHDGSPASTTRSARSSASDQEAWADERIRDTTRPWCFVISAVVVNRMELPVPVDATLADRTPSGYARRRRQGHLHRRVGRLPRPPATGWSRPWPTGGGARCCCRATSTRRGRSRARAPPTAGRWPSSSPPPASPRPRWPASCPRAGVRLAAGHRRQAARGPVVRAGAPRLRDPRRRGRPRAGRLVQHRHRGHLRACPTPRRRGATTWPPPGGSRRSTTGPCAPRPRSDEVAVPIPARPPGVGKPARRRRRRRVALVAAGVAAGVLAGRGLQQRRARR